MANNRMAGEELDKDNPVAAEAKEALSRSEQNKQTRTEIAASPERAEERMSGIDREKYDLEGYSDKDIVMSFKGGDFGEKDYARLTGESIEEDVKDPAPDVGVDPVPTQPAPITTPTPTPTPEAPAPIFPSPTGPGGPQSINQDNDIYNTVNGDGNTVDIDQNNSARQYGGTDKQSNIGATDLMDNYVLNLRKSRQAG